MKETDNPGGDEVELRAWFHQHLDDAWPAGDPFDRRRWQEETLPRLQREVGDALTPPPARPPGPAPVRPWPRLFGRVALVTAAAAVLWALAPSLTLPYGVATPPLAAPGFGANAVHGPARGHGHGSSVSAAPSMPFLAADALPKNGSLRPTGQQTKQTTRLVMAPAAHAVVPAYPVRDLLGLKPVPRGLSACGPTPAPEQAALVVGRQDLTLTAYEGGCLWFYLTRGAVVPGSLRDGAYLEALSAHRLYPMPPSLVLYLDRLR